MFTGIVEETGTVSGIQKGAHSSVLTIYADEVPKDIKAGDSVAVNGVCLTIRECSGNSFTADVMHETLSRSSLGNLRQKDRVNLERALPANGRFGGHIVAGHIDGTGAILDIKKDDNAVLYTIRAADSIMKYIVEKGSVAIDGISLTVVSLGKGNFTVSVIPHTQHTTTLSGKTIGDPVNIENDIIGKYVERLMGYSGQAEAQTSGITEEFLTRFGF